MLKQLLLCFALTTIGTPVEASLIVRDLRAPGDGLITYDTVSGLEWLDLTETAGQSYDQVMVRTAAGGDLDGWAYSRFFAENNFGAVMDLYAQFGLVFDGPSPVKSPAWTNMNYTEFGGVGWSPEIEAITSYLGCPNNDYYGTYYASDGSYIGNDGNLTPRCTFLGIVGSIWSPGSAFVKTTPNDIHWDSDDWLNSEAAPQLASFLVRQTVVPIPAAAWLFGGALGLLGVLRRGG